MRFNPPKISLSCQGLRPPPHRTSPRIPWTPPDPIAQAKPFKMCLLHGFGYISGTFVALKLVQCVKCGCYWQLTCKKISCGREHGQPHREPCLKSSLMVFLGFLTPPWSQSSQNGVPIVQLMFLYKARAPYRNIISILCWDPILGAAFS